MRLQSEKRRVEKKKDRLVGKYEALLRKQAAGGLSEEESQQLAFMEAMVE